MNRTPKTKIVSELYQGAIVMAFAGYIIWYSLDLLHGGATMPALSPGLVPLMIGGCMLVLGFMLFADAIQKQRMGASAPVDTGDGGAHDAPRSDWKSLLGALASTLLYCVGLKYLHFIMSTILFMFVLTLFFKEKKWWISVILSVVVTLLIYVIFGTLLNVRMP